jgi:hypothetical protein
MGALSSRHAKTRRVGRGAWEKQGKALVRVEVETQENGNI